MPLIAVSNEFNKENAECNLSSLLSAAPTRRDLVTEATLRSFRELQSIELGMTHQTKKIIANGLHFTVLLLPFGGLYYYATSYIAKLSPLEIGGLLFGASTINSIAGIAGIQLLPLAYSHIIPEIRKGIDYLSGIKDKEDLQKKRAEEVVATSKKSLTAAYDSIAELIEMNWEIDKKSPAKVFETLSRLSIIAKKFPLIEGAFCYYKLPKEDHIDILRRLKGIVNDILSYDFKVVSHTTYSEFNLRLLTQIPKKGLTAACIPTIADSNLHRLGKNARSQYFAVTSIITILAISIFAELYPLNSEFKIISLIPAAGVLIFISKGVYRYYHCKNLSCSHQEELQLALGTVYSGIGEYLIQSPDKDQATELKERLPLIKSIMKKKGIKTEKFLTTLEKQLEESLDETLR